MAQKKRADGSTSYGIFDGAGGGIFSSGRKARLLAQAAEEQRKDTIRGADFGVDELVAGTADPEYARAMQDQLKSFKDMALSTDKETQQQGLAGLSQLGSAVRGAIEKRRDDQATRITDAAKDMREQTQKAVAPMREMQQRTDELHALLADPNFDVNNALNRGTLITLLESNSRQMLADPADLGDALRSVGGGGLLASIVQLAGGAMKAEDYKFTKEDFIRLADASFTFHKNKYENIMAPIARDAAALEKAGAGLDVFPPGYSLSRYILSDPEDFDKPIQTAYPEPIPQTPSLNSVASGIDKLPETLAALVGAPPADSHDTREPLRRFSEDVIRGEGADRAQAGGRAEPITVSGGAPAEALTGLWKRMEAYGPDATFKVDPKTGRVFAFTPDGGRSELETSAGWFRAGGERKKMRRLLDVQHSAPVSGVIRR
jgi:hypothetical protein